MCSLVTFLRVSAMHAHPHSPRTLLHDPPHKHTHLSALRVCALEPQVGDLLHRFVDDNKKAGVLPGIYYLGWGNFFMNITRTDDGYECAKVRGCGWATDPVSE